MMPRWFRRVSAGDPAYPPRLLKLPSPPVLTYTGDLEYECAIAIVGARDAHPEAAEFARALAAAVARAGAVVISGGALGIDGAAHRGALEVDGRTWVICPTGRRHTYPTEHISLFDEIARRNGTLVWPFDDDAAVARGHFPARNRVLTALAHAVVVVQAGIPSGALNAAAWARKHSVPCYVASPPAWLHDRFRGSAFLIEEGAKIFFSLQSFLKEVGLAPHPEGRPNGRAKRPPTGLSPARRPLSPAETALVEAASFEPEHAEVLAVRAHMTPQDAASALLTLALENVLVEGPVGFFRSDNPA